MSCALAITILLSMLLASGWGQQYQQRQAENYVDGYESAYDARAPNRPLHPTPRSYGSDAPGGSEKQPAEAAPKPTPVAILKQINRHNEDGSYTYGFEGADGSFKIETKLPTGEVKGKYGFVDDTGKVRVVQYGANQYGFQPAGEGITVAPPTLVDETTNREGLSYQDYDYQQQQQQPQQQPARSAPPPPPPAPAHTQAIYAPQQRPANSPIFTPARQQSPLLRASGYDEPAPQRAPPSQAYNQGPVQFGPTPGQADPRQGPPQSRGASGGGILDQLARDYALPQDVAAPLHDISFGYY